MKNLKKMAAGMALALVFAGASSGVAVANDGAGAGQAYRCAESRVVSTSLVLNGLNETGAVMRGHPQFIGYVVNFSSRTGDWSVVGAPRPGVNGAQNLKDPMCVIGNGRNYPVGFYASTVYRTFYANRAQPRP